MSRALTDQQKLDRKFKAIDRKHARQFAEYERQRARERRTHQLGKAVSAMSMRWVSAVRSQARANAAVDWTWEGKSAARWERAATRRHITMLRLLFALEDHADKTGA